MSHLVFCDMNKLIYLSYYSLDKRNGFMAAQTKIDYIVKALACGVPVVTNTSTANPELVNEECGKVLENFSVDKVYDAVCEVIAKGKENFNSREYAERRFDKQFSYEKYEAIYCEIAKKEKNGL